MQIYRKGWGLNCHWLELSGNRPEAIISAAFPDHRNQVNVDTRSGIVQGGAELGRPMPSTSFQDDIVYQVCLWHNLVQDISELIEQLTLDNERCWW